MAKLLDEPVVDRRLIERLRARDHAAVSDLALRYSSRIHQLAIRYVKNEQDAEEVVQDVLFKVYQNIEAFRGDSALSSWIYRITFNTAMSRLRSAKAGRREGGLFPVEPAGGDGARRPTSPTGRRSATTKCSGANCVRSCSRRWPACRRSTASPCS